MEGADGKTVTFPICKGGPCSSNSNNCTGFYGVCDYTTSTCTQCRDDGDCHDYIEYGEEYTCENHFIYGNICLRSNNTDTNIATNITNNNATDDSLCSSNADCTAYRPICKSDGYCVQCMNDTRCQNIYGPHYTCGSNNYCQQGPCTNDSDCTFNTDGLDDGDIYPICNLNTGDCVKCNNDADCESGYLCLSDNCYINTTIACNSTADCSMYGLFCNGDICIGCYSDYQCSRDFGSDYVCQWSPDGNDYCTHYNNTKCYTDNDCLNLDPYNHACNVSTGECVECNNGTDCQIRWGNPTYKYNCIDNSCYWDSYLYTTTAAPCLSDDNCPHYRPKCDIDSGDCIVCFNDTDCENNVFFGEGTVCGTMSGVPYCVSDNSTGTPLTTEAEPCSSDRDCPNWGYQFRCDINTGNCVTCLNDTDCYNARDYFGEGTVCGSYSNAQGEVPYCVFPPSNDTNTDRDLCPSEGCLDPLYPVCYYGDCVACKGYGLDEDCFTNPNYGWDYGLCQFGECVNVTITPTTTNSTDTPSTTEEDTDAAFECSMNSECELEYGQGARCEDVTMDGEVISYCIPGWVNLCESEDDCLPGEICRTQAQGITYCYPYGNVTLGCSTDPDDCDEGLTCYDASSYNQSNFCYFACIEDEDCGIDGYVCSNQSYINDEDIQISTCSYQYNASMVTTDTPTNTTYYGAYNASMATIDTPTNATYYEINTTMDSCACIELWAPLCCEGGVYGNECKARCAGFDTDTCYAKTNNVTCEDDTPSTTEDTDATYECTMDSECEDIGDNGGSCREITIDGEMMKYCIPIDIKLCEDKDDCLTGSTCVTQAQGISYCQEPDDDIVCTTDGDESGCPQGLSCYNASGDENMDNFCYLACVVDVYGDDDCNSDAEGYVCSTAEINGVNLSTCIYDSTTIATDPPTSAPTEDSEEETNPSSVEQLAIFTAMIVMISYGLFM